MSNQNQTKTTEHGKSALDIAGEALHIVRAAPLHVVMSYYIGSAPLVLGLLYFWAEMSVGAFAASRCLAASLALAVLFIWMKCWQTVYTAGIRAQITGKPAPEWTVLRVARLVRTQAALQPYGLLAIPAALLVTLPFVAVVGFYQNLTVLDTGDATPGRQLAGRAWKQAGLWQKQGLGLIWLMSPWILATGMIVVFASLRLAQYINPASYATDGMVWFILLTIFAFLLTALICPFGAVVAGNIAVALALLPWLLTSFLGADTTFTLSGAGAVFNTTFLVTVFGLSYLCLDPVVKAAYTLRCFLGESQTTGEDLIVELHAIANESHRT